jgi:hypothetical protein
MNNAITAINGRRGDNPDALLKQEFPQDLQAAVKEDNIK